MYSKTSSKLEPIEQQKYPSLVIHLSAKADRVLTFFLRNIINVLEGHKVFPESVGTKVCLAPAKTKPILSMTRLQLR